MFAAATIVVIAGSLAGAATVRSTLDTSAVAALVTALDAPRRVAAVAAAVEDNGPSTATAAIASPQSVTARTVRFDSAALGGQATVAVLLPAGYDESGERYPVVYLLHGGTQNHTAFPARQWFGKEVAGRKLIAVMPHVPPFAYNAQAGGGAPFDAFIPELVRYVDSRYRTMASRESRAIGGLSMGGYGAVAAGLHHPDLFATVGALSGALADGRAARLTSALAALPAGEAPFFYLACGVADSLLPASRDFAAALAAREIAHAYREVPGGHTWEVWDPQTLAFLDLLASRQEFAPGP